MFIRVRNVLQGAPFGRRARPCGPLQLEGRDCGRRPRPGSGNWPCKSIDVLAIADEVVEPGRSSAIVTLKLIANTRSRFRETIAAGHPGLPLCRGWAGNQSGADATVRQQFDSQASLLRPSFRDDESHVVC